MGSTRYVVVDCLKFTTAVIFEDTNSNFSFIKLFIGNVYFEVIFLLVLYILQSGSTQQFVSFAEMSPLQTFVLLKDKFLFFSNRQVCHFKKGYQEQGQQVFSKHQRWLGNSGNEILASKTFCKLNFQLKNPNRSDCVDVHKIRF